MAVRSTLKTRAKIQKSLANDKIEEPRSIALPTDSVAAIVLW
jgi:hypothetical protein